MEYNALATGIATGFEFRGWSYASISISFKGGTPPSNVSSDANGWVDIGCVVIPIDQGWLLRQLSNPPINKMATPLKVRKIGFSKHETNEYVALPLYLLGRTHNRELEYAFIRRERHFVDSLGTNLLIGTNIIGPEGIIINLTEKTAYVSSCPITLKIDANQRGYFICWKLSVQHNIIVPTHSQVLIPFTSQGLPGDRDFLFELSPSQGRITLFSHLIDHHTSSIFIRNDSSKVARIPQNYRLWGVTEMFYENLFYS